MLLALCGQQVLSAFQIVQKSLAYEPEEIKAELRVLEIELADFVITNRQQVAAFGTFNRLGPLKTGRQQSHFSKNVTRSKLDVELAYQVLAFCGQKHLVCDVAFMEDNLTFLVFALGHERLQPVHRQIAACGGADLFNELYHLIKTDRVQWQQHGI